MVGVVRDPFPHTEQSKTELRLLVVFENCLIRITMQRCIQNPVQHLTWSEFCDPVKIQSLLFAKTTCSKKTPVTHPLYKFTTCLEDVK